jgi:hypothetical protein
MLKVTPIEPPTNLSGKYYVYNQCFAHVEGPVYYATRSYTDNIIERQSDLVLYEEPNNSFPINVELCISGNVIYVPKNLAGKLWPRELWLSPFHKELNCIGYYRTGKVTVGLDFEVPITKSYLDYLELSGKFLRIHSLI